MEYEKLKIMKKDKRVLNPKKLKKNGGIRKTFNKKQNEEKIINVGDIYSNDDFVEWIGIEWLFKELKKYFGDIIRKSNNDDDNITIKRLKF